VHAGPALLSVPTALVGACASGTRLDLPPGARAVAGVDVATTGSAAVVDLTLSGDRWGVHIGPGDQPVALRSLVVDAPWEFGVVALDRSGVVDVSDVVVRSLASSEEGVAASLFLAGSPARLERVAIEAGRGRAVSAMRWEADVPAVLEVRDLVVAGNEVAGDGVGAAFVFYDGAGGTLERVVIDASAGPALFLSNETAPQPGTVEATDVAIRNAGVPTTLGGTGVVVLGSMDVTLRRLLVSQAAWAAVTVEHPADGPPGPVPALRLTDAVLLGPATEPGIAPGVAVADPADLELRRVYVRDSVGAGLSLGRGRHRAGPLEVLAEDIVIRGGTPIRTPVRLPGATPEEVLVPQFGGVTVYGATLDLRRAVLADVPVVGICALGEGDLSAVAVAEDLVLQRGRAAEVQLPAGGPEDLTMPRWLGFGLLASSGGMLQATRVHVEDQEGFDAMAHPAGGPVPPTLVLEDVSFGPPGAHPGGRARATLVASDGSRVRLTRARFLDGHGAAILAAGGTDGPRTEVEASHVDLAGTIHAPCGDAPEGEPGSCVVDGRSHAGGMGLLARDGARVGLTDFRVRDSEVAGIVVASDASVEGRRGTVTGNGIGINLMVQGYDLDLLSDEVYVFGNDTDVAQEQLALPDPAIQLAPEGLP